MELIEGVGESSSPPRSFGGGAAVGVLYEIRNDVYNRLMEIGNEEAVSNPDFREILDSHFNRLPPRQSLYSLQFTIHNYLLVPNGLQLNLMVYFYLADLYRYYMSIHNCIARTIYEEILWLLSSYQCERDVFIIEYSNRFCSFLLYILETVKLCC